MIGGWLGAVRHAAAILPAPGLPAGAMPRSPGVQFHLLFVQTALDFLNRLTDCDSNDMLMSEPQACIEVFSGYLEFAVRCQHVTTRQETRVPGRQGVRVPGRSPTSASREALTALNDVRGDRRAAALALLLPLTLRHNVARISTSFWSSDGSIEVVPDCTLTA